MKPFGWLLCLIITLLVYLWQQVTPRDDEDELDF